MHRASATAPACALDEYGTSEQAAVAAPLVQRDAHADGPMTRKPGCNPGSESFNKVLAKVECCGQGPGVRSRVIADFRGLCLAQQDS